MTIPLCALSSGETAVVAACPTARLLELGFVPGTTVTCLFTSPLGDPCAYRVPDGTFALRRQDAAGILVRCP